jgi:hypothetical protein
LRSKTGPHEHLIMQAAAQPSHTRDVPREWVPDKRCALSGMTQGNFRSDAASPIARPGAAH